MKIGVIGAMQMEVDNLQANMTDTKVVEYSGITFVEGKIDGKSVVAAKCGIGKVFAAICAQTMILEFNVDMIVNIGVAGSLTKDLSVFDVAVATNVVQHDMDATGFGYRKGQIPQMPVFFFNADDNLRRLAAEVCKEVNPDIQVFEGRIASGDQFVCDQGVKDNIVKEFSAYAVEMEGAAIGQAAALNGVPFLIIRAISDKADDSATMDYPTFEAQAIEHSVKLVESFVSRIPEDAY